MLFQPLPTKKNICAVVVSHNPGEDFIANIRSTKNQVDKVVVVNNGSEKLSLGFLGKESVYLINNSENLGQGRALNQGAEWAISQGYQWFLLLDQDSVPDSSMVQELIRAYQSCPWIEKIKIIGSNCTFREIGEIKYKKECQRT